MTTPPTMPPPEREGLPTKPTVKLRDGWEWRYVEDDEGDHVEFPWGASPLSGTGYGEGDARVIVRLVRNGSGEIAVSMASRNINPPDVIIAVVRVNAPQLLGIDDVLARLGAAEAENERLREENAAGADEAKPAPGWRHYPSIPMADTGDYTDEFWSMDGSADASSVEETWVIHRRMLRPHVEAATAGLRAEVERLTTCMRTAGLAESMTPEQVDAHVHDLGANLRDTVIDSWHARAIEAAKRDERAATERDIAALVRSYGDAYAFADDIEASDYPKAAAPSENGHSEETP